MGLINGKGASLVRQRCTIGRLMRALSKGGLIEGVGFV